jgi:formiminotetrahydrofolate cyclodeaminase
MMSTGPQRIGDLSVGALLERLADDRHVAGGGALAALSGAAGAAMISMVGRLTTDRPGSEDIEDRMQRMVATADLARGEFLSLADEDMLAFQQVLDALGMPQESDEERTARHESVQRAYGRAAQVPLTVARRALELMELAEDATAFGRGEAASEGYTGASMLFAALVGAVASARVDAAALSDAARARAIWDETVALSTAADLLLADAQTAFMLRLDPPGGRIEPA